MVQLMISCVVIIAVVALVATTVTSYQQLRSTRPLGLINKQKSFANQQLTITKINTEIAMNNVFMRKSSVLFATSSDDKNSNDNNEEETEEEAERRRGGVSNSMKEKLRRELVSQGADPNYSAGPIWGNPILLVSIVITILVIVGGQGYFY